MIFKIFIKFFSIFFIFVYINYTYSKEKFEGILVSVDNEVITTFDLSERIKLVLKSLKLEDNIKNRDSVRDRVLDLLIIEKLKRKEIERSKIELSENELVSFTASVYNFPEDDFDKFKNFIKEEGLEIDVVLEQIKIELLWRKFSQQKFSPVISISREEIDRILKSQKKREGKTEYNISEIFIEENNSEPEETRKYIDKILILIENGSSFDRIATKFSDSLNANEGGNLGWLIEENIDSQILDIVKNLNIGQIKSDIKVDDGYKIIKLNNKRIISSGKGDFFSFIKFSSFKNLDALMKDIDADICSIKESDFPDIQDLSLVKFDQINSNELSLIYLEKIKNIKEGEFTEIIENKGENNKILLCKVLIENKNVAEQKVKIETRLFNKKYNQLSRTYISNLKKSANIKYINK
tara:strand:+ start:2291 stop:3520 length:1230 start_codon:yes stop_codon:yes gene_type:complete